MTNFGGKLQPRVAHLHFAVRVGVGKARLPSVFVISKINIFLRIIIKGMLCSVTLQAIKKFQLQRRFH